MDGPKTVTASFTLEPKAKVGDTPFDTLTDAYAAPPTTGNKTIRARRVEFLETLNLNLGALLTFKGGYDPAFSSNIGHYTTITGVLQISSGTLTVEGLAIR